jgi:Ca2+-binding RTX toxin-like protein
MTLQVYDYAINGTGTAADLGTTDSVDVQSSGFLGSSAASAILGTGSDHVATVDGSVVAAMPAISLGDDPDSDSGEQVTIGQTGSAYSNNSAAISILASASSIENNGILRGRVCGVYLYGNASSGMSSLTNNGEISSNATGIQRIGSEDFKLINHGLITSDSGFAYYGNGATGDQKVINDGSLVGQLWLGTGNDTYNGAGGKISGQIFGGGGNDKITGGKGAESMEGSAGRDIMTGGGGADHFIFVAVSDSTVAESGRDLISDFSHQQHDLIDLHLIDARVSTANNDGFNFIGSDAFDRHAGELRYQTEKDHTFIQGDTDGDGHADFEIALATHVGLVKGDFML